MCNRDVQQGCATGMCSRDVQQGCAAGMCNRDVQVSYSMNTVFVLSHPHPDTVHVDGSIRIEICVCATVR